MIKYNNTSKPNHIHIEDDDNKSVTQSIIKNSRRGSMETTKYLGQGDTHQIN